MVRSFVDPIRLGIVGCGAIARISHLKALSSLPQFEVRYLCDRDLGVAEAAKRMYGLQANVTADLREMSDKVDAAIVCVWPRYHFPVTTELLEMGLDVLCEKPITTTTADGIALAAAAQRAARIVAVGHWCRCLKSSWILRRLLSLEFLGEIHEVTAEFGDDLSWPMATGAYFDRNLTRGGVMFDAGIHVLDLVVWLFGEIRQIRYEDDSYSGTESNATLHGTVAIKGRDVPCRIRASWTHTLFNGLRVAGSEGEAELRFTEPDQITVRRRVAGELLRFDVREDGCDMPFQSSSPQKALLEDFALAVRSRTLPITTVESALLPLKIIEEAYSMRQSMAQPWVETWPQQT